MDAILLLGGRVFVRVCLAFKTQTPNQLTVGAFGGRDS
jgi:hypothetical protein